MAKAWIAQAEAGEAGAADEARAALSRLERHYLRHPVTGGWYDQFDRDGRVAGRDDPGVFVLSCALRRSVEAVSERLASFRVPQDQIKIAPRS